LQKLAVADRLKGELAEAPVTGLLMVTPPSVGVGVDVGSGAVVLDEPVVTVDAALPHAQIADAASISTERENSFRKCTVSPF
jgi:hypothetical protein